MRVPFLDLKLQYESIRTEIDEAIKRVIEETAFAGGPFVEQFERDFAAYCHCKYAVAVGSGTEALWIPLVVLGIGPGDEVITVPNTFIATAEAISFCGATPVFVDVEPHTYTMDPSLVESAITPKTRAIIPVHLFGQMADMDPIIAIAEKYGLSVIEDSCQAHGARYKGDRRAGSMGDAGAFSFYPGKNLGAYGEGGAIVTNNEDLAHTMKMFRDHGQTVKYQHAMVGWNARMDGIQGAILSAKLKYLPSWNEARRRKARLYHDLLAGTDGIVPPREADYAHHVYHIYAIRTQYRDDLLKGLAEKEIYCGIHYPVPVHLQDAYGNLGLKRGSFPVAEQCCNEVLSLPMCPELTDTQIEYVAGAINEITG